MGTAPTRPAPSRTAAAVAALLSALLVLACAPVIAGTAGRYLVPEGATLAAGVRVVGRLPLVDSLVVTSARPPAGAVDLGAPLGWRSLPPKADDSGRRVDTGVASTSATDAWATTRGERAVVALIDTGVAPIPALDGAVAGEIDFSGTGGGDGYGHGTFMASLIAARSDVAPGVAPAAGVLSLKVGRPDGSTDLGIVLAALQWLHGPGRAAGIRVAALALGVDADTAAARVLDRAVERLARDGVLVVTAVGNDGPSAVTSPATAVGGLSVGALDDHGTASMSDDSPAPFSGTGDDRRGTPQPDIAAAGVDIVGRLPADSVIARSYPTAEVEPGLFRGSGTSMSTALVAGVAALASSARPDLDGHALQAALRSAGRRVDAPAAVAAAMAAAEHPGPGNGPGGGNGPGNGHGNGPGGGNGNGPGGTPPVEPNAVQWRAVQWRAVQWRAVQWRGDHWGDSDWSLASWGAVQWRGYWSGQALVDLQHRAVHWRAVRWAMRPTR